MLNAVFISFVFDYLQRGWLFVISSRFAEVWHAWVKDHWGSGPLGELTKTFRTLGPHGVYAININIIFILYFFIQQMYSRPLALYIFIIFVCLP